MKNKIGIDFTYILDDTVTGIRKYGEEIVEGIRETNKDYEIILFVNEQLEHAFKEKFPEYKIVKIKFFLDNVRYLRRINAFNPFKVMKMKKEKCDLIIYPFISNYTKIVKSTKKITAILDVIPLDMVKDKQSAKYKRIKNKDVKTMNKSMNIVTISEYSKNRLIDINPEYKGEITVIPSSVAKPKETDKDIAEIIETREPYIFSINSFLKHKNQITLVKAFDLIKDDIPHKLILVRKTRIRTSR